MTVTQLDLATRKTATFPFADLPKRVRPAALAAKIAAVIKVGGVYDTGACRYFVDGEPALAGVNASAVAYCH